MKCPYCSVEIPDHIRFCPNCYRDCGFPNVRAAKRPEECAALNARWKEAHRYAIQHGTELILSSFKKAVRSSKAVLCRGLGVVSRLISSDNICFGTFYLEVDAGIRLPENNAFDRARAAVDATFFPHHEEEIRFGALFAARLSR